MAMHRFGHQRTTRLRTGPLFTPPSVRRKYVSKIVVDAVPVIAPLQPMLQQRSSVIRRMRSKPLPAESNSDPTLRTEKTFGQGSDKGERDF
jgi:hypothetical protein